MKIYTKTGDSGETSIGGGRRTAKNDISIILVGEADELSACIGLSKSQLNLLEVELLEELTHIQRGLFELGALISGFKDPEPNRFEQETKWLEERIDYWNEGLPALKHFIFAGGLPSSASLHMARAICRRMERSMVQYQKTAEKPVEPSARLLPWLNRLSDYLFVAARKVNLDADIPENEWERDLTGH